MPPIDDCRTMGSTVARMGVGASRAALAITTPGLAPARGSSCPKNRARPRAGLAAGGLVLGLGLAAHAAAPTTVYQFPGGGGPLLPYSGLVFTNNAYYGTTVYGGAYGRGTIFSINPTNGALTVLYSFAPTNDGEWPQTGLTVGGSLLYGTTAYGGKSNLGTVFSFDPVTNTEKIIYSFDHAAGTFTNTPLVYDSSAGGTLYGAGSSGGASNYGTIYKVKIANGHETTLHSFAGGSDGCYGYGGLLLYGKALYGTTPYCGTNGGGILFQIGTDSGVETILHQFGLGQDASVPLAALIETDLGSGNHLAANLCGTTAAGGASGAGSIFCYDLKHGTESVIYSFTGAADGGSPESPVLSANGVFYGTAVSGGANGYGTVFAVTAATGAEKTLYSFTGGADGAYPVGPLLQAGGLLDGTSTGPNTITGNSGSVFAVAIETGMETTLATFTGPAPNDQFNPAPHPLGGVLLGTTQNGGAKNAGSIYSLNPASGAASTLYSFTGGADGAAPQGTLQTAGALQYGVTRYGGAHGQGTVFSFDPSNSTFALLHQFTGGADGGQPAAQLSATGSILYGVTYTGGTNGAGTLFSITDTGQFTTLYSFGATATDGSLPAASLIQSGDFLYGTTSAGGANGLGTIYAVNVNTHAETVLHSFTGTDGYGPAASLVDVDGVLYGGAPYGGSTLGTSACSGGCGVVFGFDLATGQQTTYYNFTGGSDGCYFASPLTYTRGKLFGAAGCGAHSEGTIFSLKPNGSATPSTFTTLYGFTGGEDGGFSGALLTDGAKLVGATSVGGASGRGTVFELTP
jgi:uncharacterized repeat protein (TIGR03803 family)